MESAAPRINSSLTLQPNLFQVFQPMGGVRARLAEGDWVSCASANTAVKIKNDVMTANRFERMILSGDGPRLFYQNGGLAGRYFWGQKIKTI